ncbi:STOML2 [Symbiodinium sp. CCMP2456]|nr:STOML2 [Symbiodinium sp. CCMP2456]
MSYSMYQQPAFPQLYQQSTAQTSQPQQTQSQPQQQTSSYPGYAAPQQAASTPTPQAHSAPGPGQGQVVQVPPREEAVGNVAHIAVTGCTHSTVGGIVRGNFTANGQNHGRPTYKKDTQVNGLDVQLYYWDDRDGPNFCGWWFGPKVGGDQVWAYHPSSSAGTPPRTGWKVPYDGPPDPTFVITPSQPPSQAAAQAGAAQAPGQAQAAQAQAQTQANPQASQQQAAQALQQQYAAYTQQLQQQQAAYMQHYAQQAEQLKQQQEQMQQQMLAAQQKAMAMAAMKSKQEEMKAKQQAEMKRKAEEHQRIMEERKKQADEQRAAMKIRQYMQKVRLSTEENLAQHHQELADVMKEELIKCGTGAPKVKEECDQAVEQAKTRIQAMKEAKRREDERVVVVPQQIAWVVERLGRFHKILDPGLHFLVPVADRIAYAHSLKEEAIPIPNQQAITKDNVTISIDGVLYLKVVDAYQASYGVHDPTFAVTQLAQTSMRSEIGKMTLDRTFEERDAMNHAIVQAVNAAAHSWGIEVLRYEIRDIIPPTSIKQAMEMEAEAERRRRAEVLQSEGDRQSEVNLAEGKMQAAMRQARGDAEAIRERAKATAEGIRMISSAIAESRKGEQAASLRVAEQWVSAWKEMAKKSNTLIVPANAGDASGMIATATSIMKQLGKEELAKQAREAQEKATELLKELAAKVKDAQTAVEALIAAAEPLKPEAELKLEVVNKVVSSSENRAVDAGKWETYGLHSLR